MLTTNLISEKILLLKNEIFILMFALILELCLQKRF